MQATKYRLTGYRHHRDVTPMAVETFSDDLSKILKLWLKATKGRLHGLMFWRIETIQADGAYKDEGEHDVKYRIREKCACGKIFTFGYYREAWLMEKSYNNKDALQAQRLKCACGAHNFQTTWKLQTLCYKANKWKPHK